MERELNVHWMELVGGVGWGNTLLAAQLLQLMACLDVFLESAGSTGISPLEFPRDKIFFRPVRLVHVNLVTPVCLMTILGNEHLFIYFIIYILRNGFFSIPEQKVIGNIRMSNYEQI